MFSLKLSQSRSNLSLIGMIITMSFITLYIQKIVNQDEWDTHPHTPKSLKGHTIPYSYHDYINAWYKILLYQNETFSHSWFLNFDKNFNGKFPLWFLRWWSYHGPVLELLPTQLQDSVKDFSTVYKLSQHNSKLPILLGFMGKYKVPWILK
jgi:hypothetical protein